LAGAEKEIVKKIKAVVIFKKKVGRETGRDSYFASHSILFDPPQSNIRQSRHIEHSTRTPPSRHH